MWRDNLESERYRIERVLEILEHAVGRLGTGAHVSVSLLKDAIAFLRGAEEAAYEAAQADDSEPTLTACLGYCAAVRQVLATMEEALRALESGDATAAARLARSTREYALLRRDHPRLDDRLFAGTPGRGRVSDGSSESVDLTERGGSTIGSSRRPRVSTSVIHQRFPPHAGDSCSEMALDAPCPVIRVWRCLYLAAVACLLIGTHDAHRHPDRWRRRAGAERGDSRGRQGRGQSAD